MRNPGRRAMLLVVFCCIASACTRHASVPSGLEGAGDLSNFRPGGSACDLLTSGEVDLALNGSTGGATREQGRPILVGMEMCTLNAPGSEASWGVLFRAARVRFRNYKTVNKRFIEPLKILDSMGMWDEDLRTLVVLKGKSALGIRLTVSQAPLAGGRERKAYPRQTALLLAERALRRLN